MSATVEHDVDIVTGWCRRCGQSLADIQDQQLECRAAENITAISHIVRGAVLRNLARRLLP